VTEDRLAQIVRASANELKTAFDKATAIKHEGSRGAAREDAVLAFLHTRLPRTVRAVGSSEVIDSSGATSSQQDIVIVDPSTPPFLHEGNQHLYPAECVHGVIEVKGRLSKHEVRDACDKIASVKRLPKIHYLPDRRSLPDDVKLPPPTYGFVFAYTSRTSLESITENVMEWCDEHPPQDWPDGLFIFDHGNVAWFLDGKHQGSAVPGSCLGFIQPERPSDVLLLMLLNLHAVYANAWTPAVNLQSYVPHAVFGIPRWSDPCEPVWPSDATD
jgi:uncharacterized protein DUF6602